MSPPHPISRRIEPLVRALAPFAVLALGLVGLVRRVVEHRGWFAEDAYITLRFATHLAEGNGYTWNVGEAPVEGFTSFLHVSVLGLGLRLGASHGFLEAALGLGSIALCAGAFLAIVSASGGRFGPFAALALAFFLMDERTAVHATAGLDTPMYMALLGWLSYAALRFAQAPSRVHAAAVTGLSFLALLGRPDAAVFVATQGLVLLAVATRSRRDLAPPHASAWVTAPAVSRTLGAYAVLFALGLVFLAWKLSYFGHLLPTPFYIKSNRLDSTSGWPHVFGFVTSTLLPIWMAIGFALITRNPMTLVRAGIPTQRLLPAVIVIAPSMAFLAYYVTVVHEVCYLHRFEIPTYVPIAACLTGLVAREDPILALYARLRRRLPAPAVAAALALATLAAERGVYRLTNVHFPWFELVESRYYRPIGEALARTGLGPKATLVLDSAGVVPYLSRFRHLDPVGLVDNVLCGRVPLSLEEREHYLFDQRPDLYIGPVIAASPGSTSCADEPRLKTPYAEEVLLAPIEGGPYYRAYGHQPRETRCAALHLRMRVLRDAYDLVGELPFPAPTPLSYTTFAFVRRDSPYAASLRDALRPLVRGASDDPSPPS